MDKKFITILLLALSIILLAGFAAYRGINSGEGPGQFEHTSIRGDTVTIYGQGVYRHMSAEVAVQGIAQDYVTLFVGAPLLLLGLLLFRRKKGIGYFLLSGTLFYFLVTYLFYSAMGMYNELFLLYVSLLGLSFFAFILTFFSLDFRELGRQFEKEKPLRYGGLFLIFNSLMVAVLWLGIVLPPLMDGTIYPEEVAHYTTLIVQGFDLGLLLPMGVAAGWLAFCKNRMGYVFATTYLVFLALLMLALNAKILFMARLGENVVPVVFIMPTIFLVSLFFILWIFRSLSTPERTE